MQCLSLNAYAHAQGREANKGCISIYAELRPWRFSLKLSQGTVRDMLFCSNAQQQTGSTLTMHITGVLRWQPSR